MLLPKLSPGIKTSAILLYILKLRREPQVISSILLWSKVLREMQANTPFQKLRNNLLMLLQILMVILIAFAANVAECCYCCRGNSNI